MNGRPGERQGVRKPVSQFDALRAAEKSASQFDSLTAEQRQRGKPTSPTETTIKREFYDARGEPASFDGEMRPKTRASTAEETIVWGPEELSALLDKWENEGMPVVAEPYVPEPERVLEHPPFVAEPGYYRTMHLLARPSVIRHKLLARVFFLLVCKEFRSQCDLEMKMRYPYLNEYLDVKIKDIDTYLNNNGIDNSLIYMVTHEEERVPSPSLLTDSGLSFVLKSPVAHAYQFLSTTGPDPVPSLVSGKEVEEARKKLSRWRRERATWFKNKTSDAQVKYMARQFVRAFSRFGSDRNDRLREIERRILIDTRAARSKLDLRDLPIDQWGRDFQIPQGALAFLVERDDAWKVWLPSQGDRATGASEVSSQPAGKDEEDYD